MSVFRVGIADDEPLARERIRSLLAGRREFEIVVECSDGAEAALAMQNHALDVLFLDVQMPDLDGFQAIEAAGDVEMPVIVFVTAFHDYAIRAFEVRALDYLLKPFDRARFEETLTRVSERLSMRGAQTFSPEIGKLLSDLASHAPAYQSRFPVKSRGEIYFVRAEDIDWIDAEGNYVALHAGGRTHLVRETIKSVESRLDPSKFVRVHRSAIINVDRLKKLQPYFHGEYVVTLHDGTTLTSSRTYSERLRALVG
ncbi:MAG TPA: LytTR family DNA-binding domain-containing protein [Gemmatimonadaceae bacterium]|nr:LytTR family DNA-binding domain-containing protein [Gemmatimonadaceae bacterium]